MAEDGPDAASSEGEEFFETCEEIASTSGSDSGSSDGERLAYRFKQRHRSGKPDPGAFSFFDSKYAIWRTDPASIGERRLRLFQKLGVEEFINYKQPSALITPCHSFPPCSASPRVFRSISDPSPRDATKRSSSTDSVSVNLGTDSSCQCNGTESPNGNGAFSSTVSPASSILIDVGSRDDNADDHSSANSSGRDFVCRIKDLDTGKEFIVHELGSDGLWNKLKEVGTGKEFSLEEFESSLGLSPIVQEMRRVDRESRKLGSPLLPNEGKPKRKGWFRGFRKRSSGKDFAANHMVSDEKKPPWKMQRLKVRVCKKAARDLTDLYLGQEFHAHQGPIWALKFSSCGRYLASGGQDCIVRVWKIVFSSNQVAAQEDDKKIKKKRSSSASKKSNDHKVTFGLDDQPVCSLEGHTEDILDLSWSSSKLLLLSSSMDKTVRLWDVPNQECLQVFSHNDYVTCIEFNPVDDTCFLSGSLDGKVRIWSIVEHHVVDWTDLREIVTAASYTPDGTAAMIGSYKGICRFYHTNGNKLQLEGHIDVVSKKGKNFRGKKITGIQCMPGDPSKILITSNDSQVRLYDGNDLIAKYKGFRNMSSQISASFSGNGKYIVSASEDSHVYLWNVTLPSASACRGQLKLSEKSYESFFSDNVTVALPWPAENEGKNPGDRRALKLGADIFQLLKQSSFPGPCFECLTSAVFPVTDGASTTCNNNSSVAPSEAGSQVPASPSKLSSSAGVEGSEEALEEDLPSGLVIVTASLSGEIRTFQNYAKDAA